MAKWRLLVMESQQYNINSEDLSQEWTDNYNNREDSNLAQSQSYVSQLIEAASLMNSSQSSQFEQSNQQACKSNEDVEVQFQLSLIEEVRQYPCLWNTSARSFRETPKKQQAWRNIGVKLSVDGMVIILNKQHCNLENDMYAFRTTYDSFQ